MSERLTYAEAGVDVAGAEEFVDAIGDHVRSTHTDGVVTHASRYAGLFRPNLAGLRDPLLAATCDGVGTKLLVARDLGRFDTLGQDLVAMNVNDLLPLGARPLFFLDYIATGVLDPQQLEALVAGIAAACRVVGCALIGGETAEMPGLYPPGDFDLAGFAVGLVDGAHLPAPETIQAGDVVLGLPSTGVHSNGLSLARTALLDRAGMSLEAHVDALGCSVGEALLEPTALYVQPALELRQRFPFKAAAHVTGGGIAGRGKGLLGAGQRLVLDPTSFLRPPVFDLVQQAGDIPPAEMARTFNLGLGFLVVMEPARAEAALAEVGAPWLHVGEIIAGERGVELGELHVD